MLQIFVCGAGGVGKTTLTNAFFEHCKQRNGIVKSHGKTVLINESTTDRIHEVARKLMQHHEITRNDLQTDVDIWWKLQGLIVQKQLEEERQVTKPILISDRSILDCVAYGLQMMKWRFDASLYDLFMEGNESHVSDEVQKKLSDWCLSPFASDSKTTEQIMASIERYRNSLYILLHPRPDQMLGNEDDGTRYQMSKNQLEEYTRIYQKILQALNIPFVDLTTPDKEQRLNIFEDALVQKYHSTTSNKIQ